MLWELSYTEAQEIVDDFVEVSGDQEYFCLGIEKVDLNYIQACFDEVAYAPYTEPKTGKKE